MNKFIEANFWPLMVPKDHLLISNLQKDTSVPPSAMQLKPATVKQDDKLVLETEGPKDLKNPQSMTEV